jgi:glycosyltransferase involved in cell wall biosynthesis
MKVSLCLLTFNELEGCKNDVPQIKKIANQFQEIYAVDDNSSDGTVEFLKEQNIPVYLQPEKGLNAACHFAVSKCTTDAIIFFHPKGAIPVEDTLKFRPLFESGYDFVIGSRIVKGARNEEDGKILKPRKWFVIILSLVASLSFRKKGQAYLKDVLHGFRGATVVAYKKMGLIDLGKVTIDIEMVNRSYKKNLKSIEFPTTESSRIAGQTHFKAIPTGMSILEYLKREWKRKD